MLCEYEIVYRVTDINGNPLDWLKKQPGYDLNGLYFLMTVGGDYEPMEILVCKIKMS